MNRVEGHGKLAMMSLATWIVLVGAVHAQSGDETRLLEGQARQRAADARQKAAALLDFVDGVQSVNMGGTGTDYRLLIVTRTPAARRAARTELGGGEIFDGIRVSWIGPAGGADPTLAQAPALPPQAAPPQPAAAPATPPASQTVSSGPPPWATLAPASRETFYAGPYTQNPRVWPYDYSPDRPWYVIWISARTCHHSGTGWSGGRITGGSPGHPHIGR
jgi:hypothetical protein